MNRDVLILLISASSLMEHTTGLAHTMLPDKLIQLIKALHAFIRTAYIQAAIDSESFNAAHTTRLVHVRRRTTFSPFIRRAASIRVLIHVRTPRVSSTVKAESSMCFSALDTPHSDLLSALAL